MADQNVPMITMPLETWQQHNYVVGERDKRIAALEAEVAQLAKQSEGDRVARAYAAVLEVVPLLGFALGNLDPETVRGWNATQLDRWVSAMRLLPGLTPHVLEFVDEVERFARRVRQVDDFRRNRDAIADLARVRTEADERDEYERLRRKFEAADNPPGPTPYGA